MLRDSPITPELLVSGAVGISEVLTNGPEVFWAESRPDEGGRVAIMRWSSVGDDATTEVTEPTESVRTRVHEYGGGAWFVQGNRLVFSDYAAGGELFLRDLASGSLRQLTSSGHRYADGRISPDGRYFVCVRERHDGGEVDNEIVAFDLESSTEHCLLASHDFFSSPRFSADGSRLVCVAWDHPNMPWDRTELICGPFDDGTWNPRGVPGVDESIVLPDWTSDGRLLAVTDRSDWWNLVEVDPESGEQTPIVTGDFEIATPPWVFGLSRWVETPAGPVVVAGTPEGDRIIFPDGQIEDRHSAVQSIRSLHDGRVAYAASSHDEESAVWIHDGSEAARISKPRDLGLGPEFFSPPELVSFDVSGHDSDVPSGTLAHALFYEPAPPLDGVVLPPLLVMVHGGPTGSARRELNLQTRFWTSRGVAVADVDYRGSTLYGRRYRQVLDGRWGVSDVADCVAAAAHLADAGRVDATRMVIAGGSSGGLTVLNALAHHDVFAGGISRYGVTDMTALAQDTHKFEERYLDRLVGPWPEAAATYAERSPTNHADKITAPMLVLQGLDDKVVPPAQSEAIVSALEANGVPVTYVTFEGEGHGFRSAETIIASLEAQLEFMTSL